MKKKIELIIPFSWEERRPCLLDQFFYVPHPYEEHEKFPPFSWESIFHNTLPVAVEFCSGNGQWIGEKAKNERGKNWVAVERRFDRAKKIWRLAQREGLENLFVVCAEGLVFAHFYAPENGFSEIYVNFPDPWPKLRHAKHRLIQPPFLKALHRVSRKGTVASFVSDDLSYVEQMKKGLNQAEGWKLAAAHVLAEEGYGESFFRALWESKGKKIYQVQGEAQ